MEDINNNNNNNKNNNNSNSNNNNNNDDDDDNNNNKIIIIIIALRGAIRAANCLQHVSSSGPGAIVRKSRAAQRPLITCNMSSVTWYEGKLSY